GARRPAHELRPCHNRSQGQAGRYAFRNGDDVWLNSEMLNGKHFSGPPHAGLYFIRNQEDAVLPGEPFQLLKELSGGHDVATFSLDRLKNNGSYLIRAENGFEKLVLNHPET